MIILGRDTDDKGTQFETLIGQLLYKQGYQNLTFNRIGAGGEEFDITGEYTDNSGQQYRLIGECKAYRSAISITHWLKFLGKVYSEETQIGPNILGFFFALC